MAASSWSESCRSGDAPAVVTDQGVDMVGWTGSWQAALTVAPSAGVVVFEGQTLRQRVRLSAGGGRLRVRLSNEWGVDPLVIGEARVARPVGNGLGAAGAGLVTDAGSDRVLRFGGGTAVTLPPGTGCWSDPVALPVELGGSLVVSLYLPCATQGGTVHAAACCTSVVAQGNVTAQCSITGVTAMTSWYFLSGVAVEDGAGTAAGAAAGSVVMLGDSVTDGAHSTLDGDGRWPDLLAARLRADGELSTLGVLNAGIGGNRLLRDPDPPPGSPAGAFAASFGQSAVKRLERDVLDQPGVRGVVVQLGVNDLGAPVGVAPASQEVSAAELAAGFEELAIRCRARGLRVVGTTLLPFAGDAFGWHTVGREQVRSDINAWIRASGVFDTVVDFDAVMRDPDRPEHLLPAYDSGDGLHPNDAGMAALAGAFDLGTFRGLPCGAQQERAGGVEQS